MCFICHAVSSPDLGLAALRNGKAMHAAVSFNVQNSQFIQGKLSVPAVETVSALRDDCKCPARCVLYCTWLNLNCYYKL